PPRSGGPPGPPPAARACRTGRSPPLPFAPRRTGGDRDCRSWLVLLALRSAGTAGPALSLLFLSAPATPYQKSPSPEKYQVLSCRIMVTVSVMEPLSPPSVIMKVSVTLA